MASDTQIILHSVKGSYLECDEIDANFASLKTTADASKDIADANKVKLDNIEDNSTADQTDSEIKTAYENNSDTNALTDALKTKLDGIEASATIDQTGAEIKTAYEAEADTNAFTDAQVTDVSDAKAAKHTHANMTALGKLGEDSSGDLTYNGNKADTTVAQRDVYDALDSVDNTISLSANQGKVLKDVQDTQQTKLATIEDNAKDDQTGAEIKTAYENNADTNALTDTLKTKVESIGVMTNLTTATRPVNPTLYTQIWDTDLSKSIICTDNTDTANIWKDMMGTTV